MSTPESEKRTSPRKSNTTIHFTPDTPVTVGSGGCGGRGGCGGGRGGGGRGQGHHGPVAEHGSITVTR